MVDLPAFIKSLQGKGYSMAYIKSYLARFGVRAEDIDRVVNEMEGRRTYKLRPILIASGLFILLVGSGWFIFGPTGGVDRPVEAAGDASGMFSTNDLLPTNVVLRRTESAILPAGPATFTSMTNPIR